MSKQSFDEEQLLFQAKSLLENNTEHLDMQTTMSLERARTAALDTTPKSHVVAMGDSLILESGWQKKGLILAAGLLLIVATMLVLNNRNASKVILAEPMYSDIEILGASESLDFYNDLEFYQWLELDDS